MAFVVLAGQSNALGFLNTGAVDYGFDDLTYIWNNVVGGWERMIPGVNTGTPNNPAAWGPEVAFAQDFRANHPGEVLMIVKSVQGSTGVAADPVAMDWSPSSHGELFDLTADRIAAAKAHFTEWTPTTDVVLWFGGETDATDPAKAAAHAENLTGLVAAMRARWGADHIEIARISDSAALPYSLDVRVAEWAVDQADAHVDSFKTIGFGMATDGLHLAAGGQLSVGHAFHAAFDAWY